jgi:hypothetical protein
MTPSEKIERMRFILNKILPEYSIEVKSDSLNFLEQMKESTNLNLRTLIMISKIRAQFPDTWQNLATYMIQS